MNEYALITCLWSTSVVSDKCHLNVLNLYFLRASTVVEQHSTVVRELHDDMHQHFIYSHTCHKVPVLS